MATMVEIQDAYIADLTRCETVTRCYGNQRAAQRAAHKRALVKLLKQGWPEADALVVISDAKQVYLHDRMCAAFVGVVDDEGRPI